MLCRCPEGARDFSPTWSVAECGVIKNDTNYKRWFTMQYIFGRPFRTSLSASFLTPHSATLHMGLKSFAPFGASANISE
ncbi:hypothetical protein Barb4_04260 [Bacteroidales bacterium Barb4]|nr:hypothetical protein Barb4_04260 [Bacteroidales bacterium Barb4]